jgi:hypothetical protein
MLDINLIISFSLITWVLSSWISLLEERFEFIDKYFCPKCFSFWFTIIIMLIIQEPIIKTFVVASGAALINHIINKYL